MDQTSEPVDEPVSSAGKPYLIVFISGLATTAATLVGVYWLANSTSGVFVLGWYVNYILPVGAMIVGFIAASGYALASRLTDIRISRSLLTAVLVLQAGAYVTAEYVEYDETIERFKERGQLVGRAPSFFEYYDWKARNFAWEPRPGQPPEPLGGWGYVFVLLRAIGFIGSGMFAPAILYSFPYCEHCQRYMKNQTLGFLPANIPANEPPKHDHEAQERYRKDLERAAEEANEKIATICSAVAAGRCDQAKAVLRAADSDSAKRLARHIRVIISWCKQCGQGRLKMSLIENDGTRIRTTLIAEDELSTPLVREMLGREPNPDR